VMTAINRRSSSVELDPLAVLLTLAAAQTK
jgi:hypothetical protein